MRKFFNFLLNVLFPIHCLLCKKEQGVYLCKSCFQRIKYKEVCCPICNKTDTSLLLCENCKKTINLTGLIIAGDLKDESLEKIIKLYKYSGIKELSFYLALFLFNVFRDINEVNPIINKSGQRKFNKENSIIIAMPLSSRKKRFRGFNQSEIIARIISIKSKIEIFDDIKRISNTKSQTTLKAEQRFKNVNNIFKFKNNIKANVLQNKKIIIIDDIVTTGASLNELSKLLQTKKPHEIWGLVIAKN